MTQSGDYIRSLDPDKTVHYEVWRIGDPDRPDGPVGDSPQFLKEEAAHALAADFNGDEIGNATIEQREIRRRFVVVKATTIRKVVPGSLLQEQAWARRERERGRAEP